MGRLTALVAVLMIVGMLACLTAHAEDQPVYQARVTRDTTMRVEPDKSSDRVCRVETDATVFIIRWQEVWSYCTYGTSLGWLPNDRLFELSPLGDTDIPGYVRCHGLAVMLDDALLALDEFHTAVWQNDQIAMVDETGLIPMMRGTIRLAEGLYQYKPFADAESAQPGEVIAAYTTWYNGTTGGRLAKNRRYNIELAVSRLADITVQPGGSFSFNTCCGPYTTERSYRNAPNISQSGVGPGGGVCQVSTTLYEALTPLRLDITEWHVHRASGIPYAPISMDCAVGTARDFVFRNTLPYPIKLDFVVQGGSLTVVVSRGDAEDDAGA